MRQLGRVKLMHTTPRFKQALTRRLSADSSMQHKRLVLGAGEHTLARQPREEVDASGDACARDEGRPP